ncbi:MAG: TraR/DksA C4-type zinc finger protein [Massilia sp.]|nr:TraR/DksA C4-type zinc finger protein [Massilia sp.]
MNVLKQEQLARLKLMLGQRQDALAKLDHLEHAGARDLAVDEVETSPADMATVHLLNDLALEAAEHNASERMTVKHALSKFDDASYGACEECGNPIGFSRLQARPEACLCIACQTRAEQR